MKTCECVHDVASRVTWLARERGAIDRSYKAPWPSRLSSCLSGVRGSRSLWLPYSYQLSKAADRTSQTINTQCSPASSRHLTLVDMSGEDKIQPWKSTWPPPQDPRETGTSDKEEGGNGPQGQDAPEVLDYGLLKGVTIVLDGASHGDLSHEASCGGKCKLCVAQAEEAARATAMSTSVQASCQRSTTLPSDTAPWFQTPLDCV